MSDTFTHNRPITNFTYKKHSVQQLFDLKTGQVKITLNKNQKVLGFLIFEGLTAYKNWHETVKSELGSWKRDNVNLLNNCCKAIINKTLKETLAI